MSDQYHIQLGTREQVTQIVELSNEAFMVDAFFKKPEHYVRFSIEAVEKMIAEPNSAFILCCDKQDDNAIVGCMYLQWHVVEDEERIQVGWLIRPYCSLLCKLNGDIVNMIGSRQILWSSCPSALRKTRYRPSARSCRREPSHQTCRSDPAIS